MTDHQQPADSTTPRPVRGRLVAAILVGLAALAVVVALVVGLLSEASPSSGDNPDPAAPDAPQASEPPGPPIKPGGLPLPVEPNNRDELVPSHPALGTQPAVAWTTTATNLGIEAYAAERIGQSADGAVQVILLRGGSALNYVGLESATGQRRWSFNWDEPLGPGCRIPSDPERGVTLACPRAADGSITYRDLASGNVTATTAPDPAYASDDVTILSANDPALVFEVAQRGGLRDDPTGIFTIRALDRTTAALRWRKEITVPALPGPRYRAQLHGDTLVFPGTDAGGHALALALTDGARRDTWPISQPVRISPGVVGVQAPDDQPTFRNHYGATLPGEAPLAGTVQRFNEPLPYDAQPPVFIECADNPCVTARAVDGHGTRHWSHPVPPGMFLGYCNRLFLFGDPGAQKLEAVYLNGSVAWRGGELSERLTCRQGQLVQQTDNELLGLDARTGNVQWRLGVPGAPSPANQADGTTVDQVAAGMLITQPKQAAVTLYR